ncbi:ferrous iron transport protein B [Gemmatirosa kalamazoonensis]|uniref:Ferrous iron transport protein B n=1 Tax=Gemmatirosa kalamazoonensis TaxID=861299 RepID=W0RG59_9BACT|nr:ferrous iron transport protein B [Gemmatirosa kalamazoonensis]AHG90094.1 ferrous iron transport protein B [Gemmatirosa kalamazoonensis]
MSPPPAAAGRRRSSADAAPDASAVPPLVAPAATPAVLRVALVGNPNTGKSTLFNALTGLRQKVGNFAGVTVERHEGSYRGSDGTRVSVLDLPGSYSLSAGSPDEAIALEVLLGRGRDTPLPDVIVCVADAQHLERNLFFTSQLLELGRPVVLALNQMDAAEAAGIRIDVPELIHELGVTVIPTVAKRGEGVERLKLAISRATSLPRPQRLFAMPPAAADALAPVTAVLEAAGFDPMPAAMEALRLLAVTRPESHLAAATDLRPRLEAARDQLRRAGHAPERLEAELRYDWIGGVLSRVVTRAERRARTASDRIDAVVLHRVWGWVIFLALMAVVFQSIFTWATPVQDAIEGAISWLGQTLGSGLPAGDLRSLVVDGVIAGVGSVLVFLPQIALLFLFIGLLEDSGYMARAAFLMDALMRRVGLHGKSFIPMLSGYACAVPGIMAARTVENPEDRLATIMVVPLMSCSARLPVYTLLIGAFVPATALLGGILSLQGLTMLAMYLLGTVTALGVAALFKRTLLRGPMRPMILELPPYRWPSARNLLIGVTGRAKLFLRKAGTVILALSVVLWALATYPRATPNPGLAPEVQQEQALEHSALGRIGHLIEPAVRPLGFDWKIGVSIGASFAAREVFVSTMGTIYGVGEAGNDVTALRAKLRDERDPRTGQAAYTPLVAVALMVFYVYALMCMSTVAVTVRETGGGREGWRWAAIQFAYMLALAYGAALLVYQGGRLLGLG